MTPKTYGEYLRSRQAATYCGIALGTLRSWVRQRIVPARQVTARCWLFRKSELDAALDRFKSGMMI